MVEVTEDSMSAEFAAAILPVTVLVACISVLGLVGNGIVLFVYKFRYPPCTFRIFILYLALLDFVSCLVVLPTEIFVHRHWFNFPASAVWLCVVKKIVSGITVCMSAAMLLLISVDRFRKVCRPLSWQIRPVRAIQLSTAILIILSLLYLPGVVVFGKQTTNISYQGHNVTIHTCQRADEYKNAVWVSVLLPIVFYVPTISSTLANPVLYGFVLRAIFFGPLIMKDRPVSKTAGAVTAEYSQSISSSAPTGLSDVQEEMERYNQNVSSSSEPTSTKDCSHGKKKTQRGKIRRRIKCKTLIMLLVTIVFDVTMVVYLVVYTMVVQKDHIFMVATKKSVGVIFCLWRLYFFNHVINPIIYGFYDTRFRKCALTLLRKVTGRKPAATA